MDRPWIRRLVSATVVLAIVGLFYTAVQTPDAGDGVIYLFYVSFVCLAIGGPLLWWLTRP